MTDLSTDRSLLRGLRAMQRTLDLTNAQPAALKALAPGVRVRATALLGGAVTEGTLLAKLYRDNGDGTADFVLRLDAGNAVHEVTWHGSASVTVVERSLPTCTAFAGTGQRCTTCRIHKNNH